jgi:hypothetical protein
MTIITKIQSSKKNNFKTYAKNINSSDFIELLNHEELAPIIENNMPNPRENIYTPTRTLSMFLTQSLNEDRSCSKAVNDLIIQQQRQNNRLKISPIQGLIALLEKKNL